MNFSFDLRQIKYNILICAQSQQTKLLNLKNQSQFFKIRDEKNVINSFQIYYFVKTKQPIYNF